jgi:hypothetical protein
MNLDFTIGKYADLCQAIASSDYTPMTVRAYLERQDPPSKLVVIRHDVDTIPKNELEMALVESGLGISATYYFRYKGRVFQPDIMRRIAGMGHEIGYHYETLDKAKGDSEKALEIFKREIAEFREVVDIKTISMHGNPLTRWDNRNLWRKYDFRESAVLGEAYLSFNDIVYLSDTGRTWSAAHKVKDRLPSNPDGKGSPCMTSDVHSTDDVIRLIGSGQFHHLYLLTHATRWSNSTFDWAVSLLQDTAVNTVKRGIALRACVRKRIGSPGVVT